MPRRLEPASLDFASHHRSRGQAVVELALVAPVILGLLLMAVDFGRLFFSYVAVSNAAREATFYASTHAADGSFDLTTYQTEAQQAAMREANAQSQGGEGPLSVSAPRCFQPLSDMTIGCDAASNFAGGIGNQVEVTASRDFTFLTPLIGDLFGGDVTLTATATGPVLNPADVTILPHATPSPAATPTPTPTASPTPSPTPDPGATPTPTPDPGASPTPTPTASPDPMCVVPDFYHTYWNDIGALTVWHDSAGFTGTLTDDSHGKKIQRQTLTAGLTVLCSSDMIVSKN